MLEDIVVDLRKGKRPPTPQRTTANDSFAEPPDVVTDLRRGITPPDLSVRPDPPVDDDRVAVRDGTTRPVSPNQRDPLAVAADPGFRADFAERVQRHRSGELAPEEVAELQRDAALIRSISERYRDDDGERTVGERFGAGVQKGLYLGPKAALQALMGNDEGARATNLRMEQPDLSSEGAAGFVGQAVGTIAPTALAVAAAPFTGGGSLAPLVTRIPSAYYAAQAAGGALDEVRKKRDQGEEVSGAAEWTYALGSAAVEYLAEKYSIGALVRLSAPAKMRLGQQLFSRAGITDLAKVGLAGAPIEASEETITQIGQNVLGKLTVDDERGILDGALEAAGMGAIGGSLVGPIGRIASSTQQSLSENDGEGSTEPVANSPEAEANNQQALDRFAGNAEDAARSALGLPSVQQEADRQEAQALAPVEALADLYQDAEDADVETQVERLIERQSPNASALLEVLEGRVGKRPELRTKLDEAFGFSETSADPEQSESAGNLVGQSVLFRPTPSGQPFEGVLRQEGNALIVDTNRGDSAGTLYTVPNATPESPAADVGLEPAPSGDGTSTAQVVADEVPGPDGLLPRFPEGYDVSVSETGEVIVLRPSRTTEVYTEEAEVTDRSTGRVTTETVERSRSVPRTSEEQAPARIDQRSKAFNPAAAQALAERDAESQASPSRIPPPQSAEELPDYYRQVAEESQDPNEILEALEAAEADAEAAAEGLQGDPIVEYFAGGGRVRASDMEGEVGGISLSYFSNDAKPLDLIAEEDMVQEVQGRTVTPDDIREFVRANARSPKEPLNRVRQDAKALRERFKEVAGFNANPSFMEAYRAAIAERSQQLQRATQEPSGEANPATSERVQVAARALGRNFPSADGSLDYIALSAHLAESRAEVQRRFSLTDQEYAYLQEIADANAEVQRQNLPAEGAGGARPAQARDGGSEDGRGREGDGTERRESEVTPDASPQVDAPSRTELDGSTVGPTPEVPLTGDPYVYPEGTNLSDPKRPVPDADPRFEGMTLAEVEQEVGEQAVGRLVTALGFNHARHAMNSVNVQITGQSASISDEKLIKAALDRITDFAFTPASTVPPADLRGLEVAADKLDRAVKEHGEGSPEVEAALEESRRVREAMQPVFEASRYSDYKDLPYSELVAYAKAREATYGEKVVAAREDAEKRPDTPRYDLAPDGVTTTGVTASQVEEGLAPLIESAATAGVTVNVVDDPSQIPAALLGGVDPARVRGVLVISPDGGRVYVVASKFESLADAQATLLEEIDGHFGVRALLGPEADEVYAAVFEAAVDDPRMRSEVADLADRYGFDVTTYKGRIRAGEEYVAKLARSNPEHNLVQRLKYRIRTLLRRLFGQDSLRWTDEDIIGLIERGRKLRLDENIYAVRFDLFDQAPQAPKPSYQNEEGIQREVARAETALQNAKTDLRKAERDLAERRQDLAPTPQSNLFGETSGTPVPTEQPSLGQDFEPRLPTGPEADRILRPYREAVAKTQRELLDTRKRAEEARAELENQLPIFPLEAEESVPKESRAWVRSQVTAGKTPDEIAEKRPEEEREAVRTFAQSLTDAGDVRFDLDDPEGLGGKNAYQVMKATFMAKDRDSLLSRLKQAFDKYIVKNEWRRAVFMSTADELHSRAGELLEEADVLRESGLTGKADRLERVGSLLHEFGDEFITTVGRERTKATYHDRQARARLRFMMPVVQLMSEVMGDASTVKGHFSEEQVQAFVDVVDAYKSGDYSGEVGQNALKLDAAFSAFQEYLVQSGLVAPGSFRPGWWPRSVNTHVLLRHPDEFKKAVQEAAKRYAADKGTVITDPDAELVGEALFNTASAPGDGSISKIIRERPDLARAMDFDQPWGSFDPMHFVRDEDLPPVITLTGKAVPLWEGNPLSNFIGWASPKIQQAEFARWAGARDQQTGQRQKVKALFGAMDEANISSNEQERVRGIVQAQQGTYEVSALEKFSVGQRTTLDFIKNLTALNTLGLAGYASGTEFMTPFARWGAKGWSRMKAKDLKPEDLHWIEQIGLATAYETERIVQTRQFGYGEGPASVIMQNFFRWNGLNSITRFQRKMAAVAAHARIRELLYKDPEAYTPQEVLDAETLGLYRMDLQNRPKAIAELREFYDRFDKASPSERAEMAGEPGHEVVADAILVGTNQTIMESNPANRPLYATSKHPYKQLASQLMGFVHALWSGSGLLGYSRAKYAVDTEERGMFVALMRLMGALAPMFLMQLFLDEMRQAVTFDEDNPGDRRILQKMAERPLWMKGLERMDRSGFIGPYSRILSVFQAKDYGSTALISAAGPAGGILTKNLDLVGRMVFEGGETEAGENRRIRAFRRLVGQNVPLVSQINPLEDIIKGD